MNEQLNRIAHFASLVVFLAAWLVLIKIGAIREGDFWSSACYFVMGASAATGVLTKVQLRAAR